MSTDILSLGDIEMAVLPNDGRYSTRIYHSPFVLQEFFCIVARLEVILFSRKEKQ